MSLSREVQHLQQAVWKGSLPLQIRLAPADCRTYDQSDPFLIQCPRLSYLPLLLPRLRRFFGSALIDPDAASHDAWFSFEGVPLKWHYPVGLLYDLFSGAGPALSPYQPHHPHHHPPTHTQHHNNHTSSNDNNNENDHNSTPPATPLPWRLTLHFTSFPTSTLVRLDPENKVLHDAWINSIKEADFLRNGTARAIMSLGRADSTRLWTALQEHDWPSWNIVHAKLIPQGAALRHVPVRFYLPATGSEDGAVVAAGAAAAAMAGGGGSPVPSTKGGGDSPKLRTASPRSPRAAQTSSPTPQTPKAAAAAAINPPPPTMAPHIKVIQALVPALHPATRQPQTVGAALHDALPALFPSRRTPIVARPVLHGAVLPMAAVLEELMRWACFADGWVHVGVDLMA